MDNTLPNQQQYPTQPVKQQPPIPINGSKNKVGFGILFIIIVIIFLTGILNYFNILPLSKLLPNYLGWLPRKEVPTGTSQQSNNVTISPNDQTKQTLINFLPTILTPSLLSQSSSNIALIQEKQDNTFSSTLKQGSGKVTLTVSSDGKQISELLLFFPHETTASASVQLAKQITPQFLLIEPKGTWGCNQLLSKATFCENFWEEENGVRKGVGIEEPNPIKKNRQQLFLFYCEHRKESGIYSWKSCANKFSQTSVQ